METQSTKISKDDLQILDDKEKKILTDLQNVDNKERGFKKQKILELKEVYLMKMQYGLLPIKEKKNLSSYMWNNVLQKYGITYSEGHFYDLFTDEEKTPRTGTNYQTPDGELNHKWNGVVKVEGIGEIQDCQDCDAKKINGVIFNPEPEKTEKVKQDWNSSEISTPEKPDIEKYPISNILEKFKFVLNLCEENVKAMQDRFLTSLSTKGSKDELLQRQEILKIFNEIFTPKKIKELDEFCDEMIVNQKHNENLLDWRLRIGRYEKLIAKTMMVGEHFIHQVAKLLHCSAKHMKNDVLKEDIERDLKKFRSCPECGKDIADVINKQLVKADAQEDGVIKK